MASLAILDLLVPHPSDTIVSLTPLLSLDPQVHGPNPSTFGSGGQPSLRKQAQNCHWKKVLLLSGPKIGKAYSPLFTNGSPWSPWPHGPLAPLVPPALSLQHLVAAPTLTQETSTKLSLVMRWPFVKQPALVCARAHFYPN